MQTIEEFGGSTKMSLQGFWLVTAPPVVAILLLAVIIIVWKRPRTVELRTLVKTMLSGPPKEKTLDLEDAYSSRTRSDSF